jgi:flagellar basal-body rod protein FlgB
MGTTGDSTLALAERRLGWLETRQRVLAQNIANADTPGYRPRDLTDFRRLLAGLEGPPDGRARTDARHWATPRDPRARARPPR